MILRHFFLSDVSFTASGMTERLRTRIIMCNIFLRPFVGLFGRTGVLSDISKDDDLALERSFDRFEH